MANGIQNEKGDLLASLSDVDSDVSPTAQRNFRNITGKILGNITGKILVVIAAFTSIFTLYVLNLAPMDPWVFQSYHVLFLSVLGFAYYPATRKCSRDRIPWYDYILIAGAIAVQGYILIFHDVLIWRSGVMATTTDVILFTIGLILVLELTRRTTGMALPIIASIFILYVFVGQHLPGVLGHPGYTYSRFISFIYGPSGIFSVPIDVLGRYMILFFVFGAFLMKSGAGAYFVKFAFCVAGTSRGGPAKAAVVASALMGTVSGSAVANVVTTGSFTIPLMKKVGYRSQFAGATEAVASTGGQIMPPIMGAGAFIMAEITGISYSRIMLAAVIPAILYFVAVYFMVDYEAAKTRLLGFKRSQLPPVKDVLKEVYLLLPVVVIITTLLLGYSVFRAGTFGIISCLLVSWLTPKRMYPKEVLEALDKGAREAIPMMAICACAGIIMGVITLTGIGGKAAFVVLAIAGANIWLALFFTKAICVILGMGMPTTAAYAIAAAVLGPGLILLGPMPLVVHMFIFYCTITSTITPPVALSAYAGAGIAGSDPMRTGFTAFRLGIASLIVPFMFFMGPAMLWEGPMIGIIGSLVTGLIGAVALAASVQGWFVSKNTAIERLVLFAAAIAMISPDLILSIVGASLVAVIYVIRKFVVKKR